MTRSPDRQGNYWLEQVRIEPSAPAHGTITADVVVVGGGIAGLSAARRLLELGKDVVLLGGGRLLETYAAEHPHSRSFGKLERCARARFAALRDVRFTHAWGGLIGMSKDVLPIAGRNPAEPSHYLAMCGAGLPWSVLAGQCAAALVAGEDAPLARLFAPGRRYHGIDRFQSLFGKRITWALSYAFAKRIRRS